MKQLIMRWRDDGKEAVFPELSENISLKKLTELENGIDEWLEIIRYIQQNDFPPLDKAFYEKHMLGYQNFNEDQCFFITVDNIPAATITVICDYEIREGYIHMVACKPEFRGMGIGHLLNDVALYVLKKEKMQTAYLTTDDWRIPAIKTYLKADFYPDLESEPDFKKRWDDIYKQIKKDSEE